MVDQTEEFEDEFDTATNTFVSCDELKDHLLLVVPTNKKEMTGNTGPYTAVFGEVCVLTGETTENITEVPVWLENVMFSGEQLSNLLVQKLRKGKMLLAVLDGRPSKFNKRNTAFKFIEPDDNNVRGGMDEAKRLGRMAVAEYKARQAESSDSLFG
jgi:hypothetical protein